MAMNWDSLDWEVLDRLRADFLSGRAAEGPYWHTVIDLECYDLTYGERIGWKWDAVLRELALRKWSPTRGSNPPAGAGLTVLDWGCGSGIAGRRVVSAFAQRTFSRLLVHDRSELAMDYACRQAQRAFPGLAVERAGRGILEGPEPLALLVISHVLNEFDDPARSEIAGLCRRARNVLWVEPGTRDVSRTLGAWRESMRTSGLQPVAPCPHRSACGMLAAGNERHWCHFFAPVPPGVHTDSRWVKFGQRAGIDLRSLPYSFLVLDRDPAGAAPGADRPGADERRTCANQPGLSRIIGEPRHYKGFARIFNCDVAGVAELTLQKRDAPELFRRLKRAVEPAPIRWSHAGGRVTAAESEDSGAGCG